MARGSWGWDLFLVCLLFYLFICLGRYIRRDVSRLKLSLVKEVFIRCFTFSLSFDPWHFIVLINHDVKFYERLRYSSIFHSVEEN